MADGHADRSPGEALRATRLERGLDLSAAAEGTKIPKRLLEAIERDEYHKLSGPLYARSFLRSYATWLALDPEDILRLYDQTVGRPEGPPTGGDMVWKEETVEVRRVGLPWRRYGLIAVATVLAAILLSWLIWWLVARDSGSDDAEPGPATVDAVRTTSEHDPDPTPPVLGADALADSTVVVETGPVPEALAADSLVPFIEGTATDLVLRVIIPEQVGCAVQCDAQMEATAVDWSMAPSPLSAGRIEPGRIYRAAEGFVVYWGASDTFTLVLERLEGVSVVLNGVDMPVSRWRAGQRVVLDRHTLARFGG